MPSLVFFSLGRNSRDVMLRQSLLQFSALRPFASGSVLFRRPQRNAAARTLRTTVSTTVVNPTPRSFHRPTPLVLLTGPVTNTSVYSKWSNHFAENGYESIAVELTVEEEEGKRIRSSGKEIMQSFVDELALVIRRDYGFAAPIVIGHGLHALTAQKYAESHPASGLVLISGFHPGYIQKRLKKSDKQEMLTPEFYDSIPPPVFEPTFPVLLLGNYKDRLVPPRDLAGRFAEIMSEEEGVGWVSVELFDDGEEKDGVIMTGRNWRPSADRIN